MLSQQNRNQRNLCTLSHSHYLFSPHWFSAEQAEEVSHHMSFIMRTYSGCIHICICQRFSEATISLNESEALFWFYKHTIHEMNTTENESKEEHIILKCALFHQQQKLKTVVSTQESKKKEENDVDQQDLKDTKRERALTN